MANPEHLKILKQGTGAWNRWRDSENGAYPDLSGADLSGLDLNQINLDTADLNGSNLRGTILYRADLSYCTMKKAILIEGKLSQAVLAEAELNGTDLTNVDLEAANLCDADLTHAKLVKANLRRAELEGSNLSRANLVGASLFGANLKFSNLARGNLTDADLRWVDCASVNFGKANLKNADLRFCNLVQSSFNEAVLTGAKLYGTGRDDWDVRNVKCKYVYWDMEATQRSPKNRDLSPGEFERLYVALPTIEYIFENGMTPIDPLIMDRVVQAIRERRPEFDIKIDSINARGLAPSIKFTVQHDEHKESALQQVQKEYEIKLKQLESERDRYYQLLARALDAPKEFKLISAGPGAIVATDGSTVNIQQHIHNAIELQRAVADEPEQSESFAKVAKKTALDIVGGAIKDIAKGQVKEAAKEIIKLGKDLGPLLVRMAPAAYGFFKNIGG